MANVAKVCSEALALAEAGQAQRAVSLLRRAVQGQPGNAELNQTLGFCLAQAGEREQSLYFYERAYRIAPDDLANLNGLGAALMELGRYDRALPLFEGAVRDHPDDAVIRANLVSLHLFMNNAEAAVAAGRDAFAQFPDRPEILEAFAAPLQKSGRIEELVGVFREARTHYALSDELAHFLVLTLNYAHTVAPEEVFAEHVALGRRMMEHHPAVPEHDLDADPERPLRVGYISQDFRDRSAAHFIESVLTSRDRAAFAVHCYSCGSATDDMTERLRACASSWTDAADMSGCDLAERVRADGIDVLVDLTGHTGGNRLAALAHRPAPVQVTYMGYPNTTGLATVDLRIVDSTTDPAPDADRLATERLVRIDPCFLCYAPARQAPDVSPPPSASSEHVTFGSFNTHAKMSPPCLEAWARLVLAVPGSRLLLKNWALADPGIAERTRGLFAELGVEPAHLELRGETESKAEHLASYARVDVALDPFPYNGTTTTMEALWMGVPVVTLVGETHVSRVGASLLRTAGLGELVAGGVEEYVGIARALALDGASLGRLRSGLRATVRSSPLCDGVAFTRKVESVYRNAWRAWCGRRAPP